MSDTDDALDLARQARQAGRWTEARDILLAAAAEEPRDARLHFTLGGVFRELGEAREAVNALRMAVKFAPGFAAAHFNLGNALHGLGDPAAAAAHFKTAAELDPDAADHWTNLGAARRETGRAEEALEATERALALAPESSDALWNRAQLLLLLGRFGAGWQAYEQRWGAGPFSFKFRDFGSAPWDGGPLAGKKILVWGEQGLGDELIMASLLPEVAAQAGACMFECAPSLAPLFARSFPDIEVVPRGNPPDARTGAFEADCHAPLGLCARYLRGDLAAFQPSAGYLAADAGRAAELRARYAALGPGFKVGVSWRSANPLYKRLVDTTLADWRDVLAVRGVNFVNLQYQDAAAEIAAHGAAIHVDGDIDPWRDVDGWAAEIAALDLVIAVSNSAACLAGALGIPVWQLLPVAPEFYWLTERRDSVWFATMRVFRQQAPGDWSGVMAEVAQALDGMT